MLVLLGTLSCGAMNAQTVTILPGNGSTSGNGRAPQGSRLYIKDVYYISPSEVAAALSGPSLINSIGWTWNKAGAAGTPVSQSVQTTGDLVVYMQNSADVSYTKGSSFSAAITGMTKVYNGTITIPTGTAEITIDLPLGGVGTSAFTTALNQGVYIAFEYHTTTTPLATGFPLVHCVNNGTIYTYQSNTTNGDLMAVSTFRPETRFGYVFTNASPSFSGGSSQTLSVCQNASAADISSLLGVSDADNGQTLTWSLSSPPSHGSVNGVPATAGSNGGAVSPSGITYTPTNGYNGSDAFDISVSDGTASATITVNVTVNALPSVAAGTDQTVNIGDAVTLSGSGASSYTWDNGVTDGVPFNPSATANYTVTGTDGNGCSNTDQVTVNVVIPVAAITPGSINGVCSGATSASLPYSATANNPTTYSIFWSAAASGEGFVNVVDASLPSSPIVFSVPAAATPGTYLGELSVNNGYTPSGGYPISVTIYSLPNVSAGSDRVVCPGSSTTLNGSGAVSYTWNNFAQNGVPFFPTAPSMTYTVAGTDANGCTNTDQVVVTLNLPQISPSGFVNVCKGATTTITAPPGAATYTWKKNGVKIGTKTNVITVSAAGTYTVTYLDPLCGFNVSPSSVTVNVVTPPSKPVVTPASAKICDGQAATLSGPAGFDYQWYDQTNTIIPGATDQDYVSSASVTVRLSTSSLGCASVKSNPAKIVVNPLPLGTFYVKKVNKNGSLQLTAHQTNATYAWYLDGNPIPGATSINLIATQSGIYKLEVTKKGTLCFAASADTAITVNYTGPKTPFGYPGLNEDDEAEELAVIYPNPSTGIFRIQSDEALRAVVRDIQGRIVIQKDDATEIDLSTSANGIYLLQLFNAQGELVKTERLNKQ